MYNVTCSSSLYMFMVYIYELVLIEIENKIFDGN